MNTEAFTGKAEAYNKARPGYPEEAIEYIRSLVPPNAVFADIGAGTGMLTEQIAKGGHTVYAVEPNDDMRRILAITLAAYPNAEIVIGTAEETTLSDNSVDVVTCAQALGWFDLKVFRDECRRIGKRNAIVIAIHNETPGDDHVPGSHRLSSKQAAELFLRIRQCLSFQTRYTIQGKDGSKEMRQFQIIPYRLTPDTTRISNI